MQNIVAAYEKHKNLKLAADELGMKWQSLYLELRKLGVAVTGDKTRYGSDKDRLASWAESEFVRLVPHAKSQNDLQYQAKVDFKVGEEAVDVKCSTLKQSSKNFASRRWAFSVKKQELSSTFFVCFGKLDDGYKIFMIPTEIARHYQTVSIAETGNSKWSQFEVTPQDLSDFFKQLLAA